LRYGSVYLAEGDYKTAGEIFARVVEMEPDLTLGYLYLVQTYLALGDNEEAMRCLSEGSRNTGGSEALLALLGHAFGKTNRRNQALDILEQFEARSEKVYVSSWNSALVYMGLGDRDKTIEYLERTVSERYPLVCYLNAMPIWNDLRGDAGFQEILKTIGLEQ
jgi:tetratricopeptide (TPR) repeat protein